ncbi:tetraacyldisaccharide 4'-kinase [Lutimonas sp.]|uniref:tetraacyldisaccharide 4'-kinase n=1 Tax=Lutimonas sp. TaxID=1872403 RepID=UPI003D9BCF40
MNSLRKILFPFSILYGLITGLRNFAFDIGILTSKSFDIPIILVGNLSVGGTGKSPMIEYLIGHFSDSLEMAVLSRGYGRKTKGYLLADTRSTAKDIGDEPFQFHRKFPAVKVAVDEERVHGVEQLLKLKPSVDLLLMDDGFQHRYVQAGCAVLLTSYEDLYTNDLLLPAGNLRESRRGARRAQIIVVTKCPDDISGEDRNRIIDQLKPAEDQHVFFSCIKYSSRIFDGSGHRSLEEITGSQVVLVTGIANSLPMERFLSSRGIDFRHIKFSDHQRIDGDDMQKIKDGLDELPADQRIVITTEKDYVRSFIDIDLPVFYLPISTEIKGDSEKFNELIQVYVRKNKRDSKVS